MEAVFSPAKCAAFPNTPPAFEGFLTDINESADGFRRSFQQLFILEAAQRAFHQQKGQHGTYQAND